MSFKLKWICLVILNLLNITFGNYDIFLSVLKKEDQKPFKIGISGSYLPVLATVEKSIYKILKNLTLQNGAQELKRYIIDFEESGVDLKSNWKGVVNFTKNPISSYRMIRRFVKEYIPVKKYLQTIKEKEMLYKLKKIEDYTLGYPNQEDLSDSMNYFFTLQDFNDLPAKEIADGKLKGTETGVKLTPKHCFELAKFALNNKFYTLALDWLDASASIKNDPKNEDLNEKEIKILSGVIIQRHDQNWEKNIKMNHYFSFEYKINSTSHRGMRTMKEILWDKFVGNFTTYEGQQMNFNFMALCKGAKLRTAKQESKLYCWMDSKRAAYWIINPLKMELINKIPYVILIHNVLPDSWTTKVIATASKNIRHTPKNPELVRPSEYTYVPSVGFPNIPIDVRGELLFGFKTENSSLQVNAYASGSYLGPHLDTERHLIKLDPFSRQLFVSTVFYLSDVEEGGETAFLYLGFTVKATKGSVLMWYPTLRNGDGDNRMWHSACPVVLGHKWVTAPWIDLEANFLRRPCLLNKNE